MMREGALPTPHGIYNLANFLRTLALPDEVKHWSLTTLRDRLVKIGAKVVRHGRSITFQMAEVMVPRALFQQVLGGRIVRASADVGMRQQKIDDDLNAGVNAPRTLRRMGRDVVED